MESLNHISEIELIGVDDTIFPIKAIRDALRQRHPNGPLGIKHTTHLKEDRKMTNKELATEYNALLEKYNIKRDPVVRFSTAALGEKRLADLKAEIAKLPLATKTETAKTEAPKAKTPEPKAAKPTVTKAKGSKAAPAKIPPSVPAPSLSSALPVPAASKFRPAVEGQKMRYKMLKENPATTRKEYIAACVAIGIKASTAGQQWGFSMKELERRFEQS